MALDVFTVTLVAALAVVPATVSVPERVPFVSSFRSLTLSVWTRALLAEIEVPSGGVRVAVLFHSDPPRHRFSCS
jgi:hypothetical protein